ncbi:unnamed protein product, partial [Rotaria sp. Silwood2]
QQNNTTESSSPSNDELEIQETEPIITTATTSEGLLSSSSVPKTARDKFFENLQHEKDKNRWSAKCLLCEKPKRVIDKLGVTSNFTRHAREYHKKQNDQWLNEFKNVNSIVQKHKITNHFQKKSHSPVHQSYGPNHTRQIQLSMAIVNDLIINLGLPLSIVEKPAFISFMQKVDSKFTMTRRRTLTRTTIPFLDDKMSDHLKTFC